MSRPKRRTFFLGLLVYFGVVGVAWTGFFFLFAAWVPGWPPLGRGALNLFAALVVSLVVFLLWGRALGRRRPDFFQVFNDAFQRIARGDYSVQIPVESHKPEGPAGPLHVVYQNLNAMAESLARVEELRKQFVADVSHEFQSPLTSILGFSQTLRSPDLAEDQRLHYLGIIEAEARRLSRLSDNLLKLNSLDDRDGPPDPRPFRLDVQIRQVIVNLEPLWSAKRLRVEADLTAIELVGNEELWTQVWTNLIQNAIKFTPEGGSVTLRTVTEPAMAVEVKDTGIGLTDEQLPRIFERFYKAESSRTVGEGTGSGLGLALVQRIVTLHGGTVEAESPGLGQGTTVRVRLPSP